MAAPIDSVALVQLAVPLGCDFYCGRGGAEAKGWAAMPTAAMRPPAPEFVFANQTLPGIIRRAFPARFAIGEYVIK